VVWYCGNERARPPCRWSIEYLFLAGTGNPDRDFHPTPVINVVVVDDHAVVREGIKRIVSESGGMTVSGEASDGHEAIRVIKNQPCDVVLLDITMPAYEILSDREYQVLCMIASGKTATQVAEELALSVKTISTYRVRLLEKLNMKNNAELTRYAIKEGLVD